MSGLRLNELHPAPGSRPSRKRVGRGPGSGYGKTAGRGTKGQKSRAGSGPRVGFEGGQLPFQQRVPKFGFSSRIGRVTAEVRLSELKKIKGDTVSLSTLQQAGVIGRGVRRARIICSGDITRALTVQSDGRDVKLTRGAMAAVEQAGGRIETMQRRTPPAPRKRSRQDKPPATDAVPVADQGNASATEADAPPPEGEG